MADPAPPPPLDCRVHFYSSSPLLTAYEIPVPAATSALIFVGGLMDGPHTVPFIHAISRHLAATMPAYSVIEARLTSSFSGCGHSSLSRDASELAKLVHYVRHHLQRRHIVLVGHSTGSQDCIHYALSSHQTANPVDALILQGAVSDRQWLSSIIPSDVLQHSLAHATDLISQGRPEEMMPRRPRVKLTSTIPPHDKKQWNYYPSFFPPMTAYRWHSLAAPTGGDDDYFSADLPLSRLQETFGQLGRPTLILHSENDEAVPKDVDKLALIGRWKSIARDGVISDLSGVIPAAGHQVKEEQGRIWISSAVEKFLRETFPDTGSASSPSPGTGSGGGEKL